MKQLLCSFIYLFLFTSISLAGKGKDSLEIAIDKQIKYIDSVEKSFRWQTNNVTLANGAVTLNLSSNFKYLNPEQSKYILHDLWENPPREDVLGMIFPIAKGPFSDSSYAFIITFDEAGYVKDNDAEKIDYDDMLHEIQKAEPDENKERQKEGYEPIHMMGWAARPFYDKENKVLHWAKELKFGDDSIHTLNYEVRVLGRRGYLSLNAIATMNELEMVKADIKNVLKIPGFNDGYRYKDYVSGTDKVAEYGIGALVAGGILAKTGVLAMIGKFLLAAWKFILLGVAATFGAIKRFFTSKFGKKEVQ